MSVIDREMTLVTHMMEHAEAAAAGDGRAQQHVERDANALIRWHDWTPDSVCEFLGVLFGEVNR